MIDAKSFSVLKTNKSLLFLICATLILVIFGFYFTAQFLTFNETRPGLTLYDPLIDLIKPIDLSRPIFLCTYGCIIIGLIASMTTPERIIKTQIAICCLLFFRVLSMSLLPLEAPEDIIPLQDAFLKHTAYGDKVLLKDLFFSGHTASVVLLYHLVNHLKISRFLLIMSVVIGSMLIVQHVHYTIDVLFAYAFAHLAALSSTLLTQKALLYARFVSKFVLVRKNVLDRRF